MKKNDKKMLLLIAVIIVILFIINFILKQPVLESFIDGNFKLCKEDDCECLKLNTAPDGTCVKYKISKKPNTPEYKNKEYYMTHVVRNNLYPMKRNLDILLFVGRGMRKEKKRFESVPNMINSIQNYEKGKYSIDPKTQSLFLVFEKANRILSYFNKDNEPYMKYLIIDVDHGGDSKEVLKSYGITEKIVPMIYLINEASKEKKFLKFNIEDDKCFLLQKLLIFIANGDMGLISYLNHLHDPFLGTEFRHDSRKNEWYQENPGFRIHSEGTEMCKLIDYRDLPKDIVEKAIELSKDS